MDIKNSYYTISEAAKILQVTCQYVRELARENCFSTQKIGTQWLIEKESLFKYIDDNKIVINPPDHIRVGNDVPNVVALSFFSGAMGLDIGMKKGGIKPLLACEFNKACRETIYSNDKKIGLIGDINKYSVDDIFKFANINKDTKIDVIFGGPPCQAFSTAGNRKAFDDERGNVFLKYLSIIQEIKPEYVVIENVRGLLSAPYFYKNYKKPFKGAAMLIILDKLKEIGYSVSFNLYNAANFGAPQIRERVVIIGKLGKEKVDYLEPTNSENGEFDLPKWRTLKDAFDLLPNDVIHHSIDFPERRLKYYRMLKEGQYWKDLPEELAKEAMGKSYYLGGGKTGFYRRLCYSKPSPTLVTNPAMPATDLCHPSLDRPLSIEEYKCIQEFPQDWIICGKILDQYKQIGNAVPIKLGQAIAKRLLDDMNGKKIDKKFKSFEYSRYKNTNEISFMEFMKDVLNKIGE